MNQPDGGAERYRDIQARQKAALAAAVRGRYIHRHPAITPENMTRRVRRAMAAIVSDGGLTWAAKIKAAGRVLGVDPAATRAFLGDYLANAPAVKAAPKAKAYNAPAGHPPPAHEIKAVRAGGDPITFVAEHPSITLNRQTRNAAKAERHRPRKPGPAEQPRRARRARHARRRGVSP